MSLATKISNVFKSGVERTMTAKRNILWSFGVKAVGIAISLLLVPLTLSYLAEEEYGIWLTLSSMLAWISFFDIGLTNGLRNKLTEALTLGDTDRAKTYLSTTLVLLIGLIGTLILVLAIAYKFIDWQGVFNSKTLTSETLGRVAFFTIAFFGLQFVLKIVTALYFAVQRAALADFLNVLGQLVALIAIWLLTKLTPHGKLLYVAMVLSTTPVIVFLAAYFFAFNGKYKSIRPALKAVNFKYSKDLIGLGVNFFIIQAASLVLFTTSNFIITQMFGPSDVTVYNIAFKYFSVVTMGFAILLSPLWSAYTEAHVSGDYDWIKKTLRMTRYLWVGTVIGTLLMIVVAPWVYHLWVGENVASQIPLSLSIACALFVIISNWNNTIAFLLNGIGKIRLQIIGSCVIMILYIPLAIWFCKMFGVGGVLYALFFVLLPGAILGPIQTQKIINRTAKGIWDK